ncbi:hypothetical protein FQZ97_882560 [compost metagenome]
MARAGRQASSSQVRRRRPGWPRPARIPSTRKKAKAAELWPLGKLKVVRGSVSTSGRARANRCLSPVLASAVATRVTTVKLAARHWRNSSSRPPSRAPARSWVWKSPRRVTSTMNLSRPVWRCSWTSVIKPWSSACRCGQPISRAPSAARQKPAAMGLAQRFSRRVLWMIRPNMTTSVSSTTPASPQKPSGSGRRRAAPVAQPGTR